MGRSHRNRSSGGPCAPTVDAMANTPNVYIGPANAGRWLEEAVRSGGGAVVDDPASAAAVVWLSERDADGLRDVLATGERIRWVQLPWAGVGPFVPLLDDVRTWTCAKGAYARSTAEHALMLALAGYRDLHVYARARTWLPEAGRVLHDQRVTVVGGGGIARELLRLLGPFGCATTVVRRSDQPVPGADRTVTVERLDDVLADTDLVVLALALTEETRGVIGADQLAVMPEHAYLVNVARGQHVDTGALVDALRTGGIRGAGLDVTDPEPLPDGHPLWRMPNVLITPHVANTREMAEPELSERVTDNVRRFAAGEPLEGVVDPKLGY